MYKAMIVDDESFIVEGLKVLIDWNNMGFDICDVAYDGLSALSKILELKPHLVITDIKMPTITGLELMGKVKAVLPKTQFLILSGYRDFEFAKEAIVKDAKGYLLKPVNKEELLELLRQAKSDIESMEYTEFEIAHLQKKLAESMPVLKEKHLWEIVNGYYNQKNDIIQRFEFLGIDSSFAQYVICLLELGDPNDNVAEKQLMFFAVRSIVEEIISGNNDIIMFDSHSNRICIIFTFMSDEKIPDEQLTETLNQIIAAVENYLKIKVFIGKSNTYRDIEKMSVAYKECEKALKARLVFPYDTIISIEQINLDEFKFAYPVKLESDMLSLLELGEMKAIEKFDEILRMMLNSHCLPDYIYYSCINIISDIIKLIIPMGIPAELILGPQEIKIEKILELRSIEELKLYVASIIEKAITQINKKRRKKIHSFINEVVQYIDNNYAENLTLEALAGKFHINSCYLSQLFKKETGRTFLEYLTYIRLTEAKRLLLNTDYKVYEIAAMVGYSSQRYFSDLFEKNMGCKPTVFKKES